LPAFLKAIAPALGASAGANAWGTNRGQIDDFARRMIDRTTAELAEELAAVRS
jgi:hypothetical protein